ncbi:MAG: serine/threonine protein kinase, partial [Chitinispirillaceae bacterium]|nr:serine/threonine protein kinase [Chitinispirillaceae bacterium]
MYDDTLPLASKTDRANGVVLPDGTQSLPLGSGSIAGLLGVGGMSNVYKIWNPQLEQYRAVKLMKPDLSAESRQRFQTEIKITAALSHPNIIEIHSVGEWNTLSYIEMEYIDGSTLADCISKKGALPMQVCTALGILMARALEYAHDKEYTLYGKTYRGLIHRDLKTSNIMIAADGRVKLMDFGIARPVETSLMTLDGAVMGTMQYLAPEQIDGKNVGVGADIYALGSILYEAFTGRKAFPQKNLSQLMSAKTANIFVPLRFFTIKIPRRLKKLVARCMVLDPSKRPSSASALLKELETIHFSLTPETPENTVVRFMHSSGENKRTIYAIRRRLPAVTLAGGVLAGLVAGGIIGYAYLRSPLPEKPRSADTAATPPKPVEPPPQPAVPKIIPSPAPT